MKPCARARARDRAAPASGTAGARLPFERCTGAAAWPGGAASAGDPGLSGGSARARAQRCGRGAGAARAPGAQTLAGLRPRLVVDGRHKLELLRASGRQRLARARQLGQLLLLLQLRELRAGAAAAQPRVRV
jgi:hypothetical protein